MCNNNLSLINILLILHYVITFFRKLDYSNLVFSIFYSEPFFKFHSIISNNSQIFMILIFYYRIFTHITFSMTNIEYLFVKKV